MALRWIAPQLPLGALVDRERLKFLPEVLLRFKENFEFPDTAEDGQRGFTLERLPHDLIGPRFILKGIDELEGSGTTELVDFGPFYSNQSIILPVGDERRPFGFVELSQGPDYRKATLSASVKAIGKSIVEAHGGSVTVHGVAGEGSKFTICLPDRKERGIN